jgi:hypothetical protein
LPYAFADSLLRNNNSYSISRARISAMFLQTTKNRTPSVLRDSQATSLSQSSPDKKFKKFQNIKGQVLKAWKSYE